MHLYFNAILIFLKTLASSLSFIYSKNFFWILRLCYYNFLCFDEDLMKRTVLKLLFQIMAGQNELFVEK